MLAVLELLTVIDNKLGLSDEKITEKSAANLLGVSPSFLRMARLRGTVGGRTPGPSYYRLGRRVLYCRADLEKWLAAHRIDRPESRNASRA
jgi:hypothetical protein